MSGKHDETDTLAKSTKESLKITANNENVEDVVIRKDDKKKVELGEAASSKTKQGDIQKNKAEAESGEEGINTDTKQKEEITQHSKCRLNDGTLIPLLGLGVYLVPPNMTCELVYQALKIGYRLIDTAQIYRNEREVSEGVLKWIHENPEQNKRSDVYIMTKVWDSFHGYENCKKSVKLSIRKICIPGIDYIDLFLIHSPNSTPEKRIQTYQALQEARDSGYVKSLGVSNYGIHHLKELFNWPGLVHKPVCNQLEIHPWLMRRELVTFCKEHEISLQAYSPLAKGRKFSDPTVNSLARRYKKSNAQILIRWSVQKGYVCLPKTMQKDRLVRNFDIWDFKLSHEDMQALSHEDDYFITGWDPTLYKN